VSSQGTYGIVECVRHVNTRQRLARKIIKLTSKQEEENELPATAVREIIVLKAIHQENIIKFVLTMRKNARIESLVFI